MVTNGQDAELLYTDTGQVLATGMEAIPDCRQALQLLPTLVFRERMEGKKRSGKLRILNTFDVEICCRRWGSGGL